MMGGTSGMTWGDIQQQCIDGTTTSGLVLHCQALADYSSDQGDSGGTIFFWPDTPPYDQYIDLLGIHWGQVVDANLGCDWGCGIYSQIGNIKRDLGAIPTH